MQASRPCSSKFVAVASHSDAQSVSDFDRRLVTERGCPIFERTPPLPRMHQDSFQYCHASDYVSYVPVCLYQHHRISAPKEMRCNKRSAPSAYLSLTSERRSCKPIGCSRYARPLPKTSIRDFSSKQRLPSCYPRHRYLYPMVQWQVLRCPSDWHSLVTSLPFHCFAR